MTLTKMRGCFEKLDMKSLRLRLEFRRAGEENSKGKKKISPKQC